MKQIIWTQSYSLKFVYLMIVILAYLFDLLIECKRVGPGVMSTNGWLQFPPRFLELDLDAVSSFRLGADSSKSHSCSILICWERIKG